MIFLDSSVIYAGADERDARCDEANRLIADAMADGDPIVTHNYVILESLALLHRRLGRASAVRCQEQISQFEVTWVDPALHARAFEDFRQRPSRRVSFVDCVSFALMRARGVRKALAFDDDFRAEGFELYGA